MLGSLPSLTIRLLHDPDLYGPLFPDGTAHCPFCHLPPTPAPSPKMLLPHPPLPAPATCTPRAPLALFPTGGRRPQTARPHNHPPKTSSTYLLAPPLASFSKLSRTHS
eukprot:tig00020563_g11348.t1